MKEHYDFTNACPNPYAERMKNGYSVAIHYETVEDLDANAAISTIKALLKQPGLNSLHLYVRNNRNIDSNLGDGKYGEHVRGLSEIDNGEYVHLSASK